ncbi:MAG: replication-associated recombination protein A [Candidatus Omnitrophica bacterium]|nr:replication-associated recombination protein A [Candidatus Omnitrophota bacterium]
MDLFESHAKPVVQTQEPLAARMRPRTVEEFVGQEHLVGPGKLLRRAIEADRITSLILFGPPGCGKTALARVIANRTQADVEQLNATAAGVAEVRDAIARSKERMRLKGTRTLLFIDEIHRFNKTQQDVLMPDVESGNPLLIGATTFNPFFALLAALVSRSLVCEFKPLRREDLRLILTRALTDRERGLGALPILLEDDARDYLAEACDGDARRALNALELAVLTTAAGTPPTAGSPKEVSEGVAGGPTEPGHPRSGSATGVLKDAVLRPTAAGTPPLAGSPKEVSEGVAGGPTEPGTPPSGGVDEGRVPAHSAFRGRPDSGRFRSAPDDSRGSVKPTPTTNDVIHITRAVIEESIQKKAVVYDKTDDAHYDTISAFIKSMRGSDPDATLYWLAKMLYAGEDPRFMARRIVICAAEDVGNADPHALVLATAAMQAAEFVGLPECRIPLAQAAVYIACAPKSNAAYLGIERAMKDVEAGRTLEVPSHLQDAHYSGAKKLGRGAGYKYAHDFPTHHVKQDYLPERRVYYEPTDLGVEKTIKLWLEKLRKQE